MFTQRRSVRRYKTDAIEEAKLNKVLEAARWAPSWANTQCAELVIVKDESIKKKLAETLSPKNPATLAVERAPVVVVVCGKLGTSGFYSGKALTKFGDWYLYDLGLVTENICMAAHEEGLGTVIVGAFDQDKTKEILGVPETHEVVVLLPLGYPDHEPPAPKRKAMEEFVHWDKF
jgi:nitroreductase